MRVVEESVNAVDGHEHTRTGAEVTDAAPRAIQLVVAYLYEKLRHRFEQEVVAEAAIELVRVEVYLGVVAAAG